MKVDVRMVIYAYLLYSILPIVAYYTGGYLLALCCLATLYFFVDKRFWSQRVFTFLAPFLYMFLLDMLYAIRYEGISILKVYTLFAGYIVLFMCVFAVNFEKQQTRRMVRCILILFFVTAITSIIVLQTDKNAARVLATGMENAYTAQLYSGNVGGYTIVYSLVILYPLVVLLMKKKLLNKVLFIVFSIVTVWYIINAMYAYAILFMGIGILTLFFSANTKTKKVLLYMVLILVALIIFSQTLANCFIYLSDISTDHEMSVKFVDIANAFSGKSIVGEDAKGRMELYAKSFELFLQYPLLGTWYKGGVSVGGHSFILDTLAKFGIFGLTGLIWMYYAIYNFIIKPYKYCEGIGFIVISFALAIGLSLINTQMWLHVITLYTSLFVKYVFEKEGNINEKNCVGL